MPTSGSDLGHLAPAGTELVLSDVWWDGNTQLRSGAAHTSQPGSTVTHNGVVNLNTNVNLGPSPLNDVTETIAPSSNGLKAWNFPFSQTGTGSAVVTGGTLYLTRLPLAGGTVVTNLWFKIATAASGITTAQNFGGLYSASGALLATSADLSTVIGTNTGAIQAAMTTAYTVPVGGGFFYVGFFFNAATTEPVLGCFINQLTVTTGAQAMGSVTTFGNTAATFPFAVNTTGNTTALPASLTLTSNSATNAFTYWVGVN